jgi:hypothetical protein
VPWQLPEEDSTEHGVTNCLYIRPAPGDTTVMRTFLIVALLLVPATAFAQYAPPPPAPGYYQPSAPPPGIHRSGFIIGFSLGGGAMNCGACSSDSALSGVALDIHLGGMLTPTLALMFDGWGVAHPIDGGTIVHVMDTVALQAWLSNEFWLKGGLGAGQLSVSDSNGNTVARSETGFGAFGSAGLELFQGQHFAFDVQLRLGSVKYDSGSVHMGALVAGFNWY